MFQEYNETFEPIARELLANIPPIHSSLALEKAVQHYEKNMDYQLYMWMMHEKVVGLIGIDVHAHTFTVCHLIVHPSFQNKGIGHAMVTAMQHMQEPRAMTSSEVTKQFLATCWKNLCEQHHIRETLP